MKRRVGGDNEGHKVWLKQRGFAGGQHGASRATLQTPISGQNGTIWRNYVPDARRELSAILETVVIVVVVRWRSPALMRWNQKLRENLSESFFCVGPSQEVTAGNWEWQVQKWA